MTPVASIRVGERRREDYGDIDGLAESIGKYGLLHPVVIDDDGNLVAGERRLRACQQLGWTEIETTNVGLLSEAARHEIELEENLRRKDLTSYEQSKGLAELAETAAEVLRDFSADLAEKSGRGRPPKPDSNDKIAEHIGRPRRTIETAQAHVETADAFPVLQADGWKQSHVLGVREQLERLPEPEREPAVRVAVKPYIHPKDAVTMLGRLASKPEPERQRIYALDASTDPRDNSEVLTTLYETPPMPDPRLTILERVVADLRAATKPYPHDDETPELSAIRDRLREIVNAIREKGAHRVEAVS